MAIPANSSPPTTKSLSQLGRKVREPVFSQVKFLTRRIQGRISPLARRAFGIPPPYDFTSSACIVKQVIEFQCQGHQLVLEADANTPLYDTIAEIVDYDCYQLSSIRPRGHGESIIIDIGANIGVFSVLTAKLYSGRVVACEPLDENCETLRANLRRNQVDNVSVTPKAVVAENGPVTFVATEHLSVGGRVVRDRAGRVPGTEITVPGISVTSVLSEFLDNGIDLIKVDCEGGEYEIMSQITKSVSERIRAFTFEVHDLDAYRNVRCFRSDLERRLGYRTLYRPDAFGRLNLHHILAIR